MMRCEVMDEPFTKETVIGFTHAEIRARDRDALDANFSLGNRLEPGDAAQERRLAAAGWAEQAGDAPAFNLEVDPGDDCVRSVALDDAVEFKVG